MMFHLRRLFTSPVFEGDEEKTRRASLLNAVTLTILAFLILLLFGNFLGGKTPAITLVIDIIMIVALLPFYYLLHRGKVKLVGSALGILGFIFITAVNISLGTIRTPTTAVYLFLVILAGVIFELRGIVISSVASSLAVLGLILAENAGLLPQPDYSVTITQWITYTSLFGLTGWLAFFTYQTTRDTLAHAEQEIAERKQSEAALSEGEEKFRNIVEYATNGIVLTDEHGIVVEWNPAQENIVGVARGEVIGQPLWDVQFRSAHPNRRTPEMSGNLKKAFQNMLATGEIPERVREQETTFYRSDGVERVTHAIVFSIKTPKGFRLAGISQDVTKRKKAEEAVHESESRFREVLENSLDASYKRNILTNSYDYLSPVFERLSGYTADETMTFSVETVLGLIHPDDMHQVQSVIAESASDISRKSYQVDYRFKHKDGRYRWFHDQFVVVRDTQGHSLAWIGSMSDITERKQMEEELKTQHDFAKQIVNMMGQGLTVTNGDGCFEFVNPVYAFNFLGYAPADLIGKHPSEVTIPEDHLTLARQKAIREEGKTTTYETRLRHRDGTIVPVSITGVSRNRNGKYSGTIAVVTDLTERNRMEEALYESERFARSIVDAVTEEIVILDEQGCIVASNRAWREVAKTVVPPVIDFVCEGANYLDVCDATVGADAMYAKAMADGIRSVIKGQQTEFSLEYPCDFPDEVRWFNAKVTRFADDGPIRLVVAHENITARKLAALALQKAHDELEHRVIERTADLIRTNAELDRANIDLKHASRLKDEFLSSMSHELRTPLTGILGLSESLQMKTYGELSEKQLKAIHTIEISGQHLLALINDILDLSKIEAGKFDIQQEFFSVLEICQASLQLTKNLAQNKQQQVSFVMEPASIIMLADARRLKQMLVNLIGNAIKFTPVEGKLGLDVQGDESNRLVKFTVWDKGIGIKPEDVQMLFKPFVQIDGRLARQYSGTGLGLSLVKRMTDLQGGSVEVESVFGEGSRFTILLPWKTKD